MVVLDSCPADMLLLFQLDGQVFKFCETVDHSFLVMVMIMNLCSTFSILYIKCALQGIDMNEMKPDHNSRSSMPYSLRIVFGFFYVPLGFV